MTRLPGTFVLLLATVCAWPAEFTVDAGDLGKRVFALNGVNAGPGHVKGHPEMKLTAQYQEMGIPLVRTHDYYGPGDFSNIFFNGWNADPYDHSNYDFSDTDAVIEEVQEAGCQVMFRLGESWYQLHPHNQIPPDFGTVAHVCKHIAMHYGADECTPYKCRIRLWEIWNEPNHSMFWDQSADPDLHTFWGLYAQVAKQLKDKFPYIKVGGPGMAGGPDEEIEDLAGQFARACRIKEAPLDFYSWHSYNRDHDGPYVFARQAQKVRQALNEEDFAKTVNVLGEWSSANINVEDPEWRATLYNMDGAAFTAAALIYMHLYSDIRYACRYRGDFHSGDEGFGLVDSQGRIKKPGYAFQAYAGLFPQRDRRKMYLLGGEGGDQEHRAMMATIDEGRSVVNVLISLWRCPGEGFQLTVNNLPLNWARPMMEHYIVSRRWDYHQMVRRTVLPRSHAEPQVVYEAPKMLRDGGTVHLVRFYDAAKFPTLSPEQVAPIQ